MCHLSSRRKRMGEKCICFFLAINKTLKITVIIGDGFVGALLGGRIDERVICFSSSSSNEGFKGKKLNSLTVISLCSDYSLLKGGYSVSLFHGSISHPVALVVGDPYSSL